MAVGNASPHSTNVLLSAPDSETGAVRVGDGPQVVDVYLDFLCPYCNQLQTGWGDQLTDAAAAGKITLNYRPVAVLDSYSQGTEYSMRAANAFMCAADADGTQAFAYFTELFAKQPAENSPGLDDDTLISMAQGHGIDIADCQDARTWADVIAKTTASMPSQGTPLVVIDGRPVSNNDIFGDRDYFANVFS